MNNEKILNQETKQEGNTVVVTRTVEEVLTRAEIQQRIQNVKANKEAIAAQSQNLKQAYDKWVDQENQLNEMLKLIPEEEIATL